MDILGHPRSLTTLMVVRNAGLASLGMNLFAVVLNAEAFTSVAQRKPVLLWIIKGSKY